MILIADSGSTKTDWVLASDGETLWQGKTQGINPVHQSPDGIHRILEEELLSTLPSSPVESLYFYGSGCTPVHIPAMKQLLSNVLSLHTIEVESDLTGAARSLCGRESGIACILGTGANSCLYDGQHIVQNTPALGYILGDEGSGAVLGRKFMNAIFKNPQLAAVRDDFLKEQQMTMADIIQRVYREPLANRFLASTSLYIGKHLDHPLLRQLVVDNFREFLRGNVVPYQHPELPVHFVGSMASNYPEALKEAAKKENFHVGTIVQSPIEGLVKYHSL